MASLGRLVAVGRTSDVYEYGPGAVVKVPRPHVPDHWASREAEYTAAVRTLDVPAPSVIDLIEIDGRHAIVFERVDGRSMWEHMFDDPGRIPEFARQLAETHRRIFAAGPPDALEGLIDRMQMKLADVDQISMTERADACALARSLPRGAALLHGDLHPGNVLMTADGPVAIDWFDASIGHPVGDIVRSSLLMRPFGDGGDPPHLPGADPSMLTTLHHAYVGAMAEQLDIEQTVLAQWEALVAASRLSEGAQSDEPALVELWRSRDEAPSSPLFEAISAAGDRSGPGTRHRGRDTTP